MVDASSVSGIIHGIDLAKGGLTGRAAGELGPVAFCWIRPFAAQDLDSISRTHKQYHRPSGGRVQPHPSGRIPSPRRTRLGA